MVGEVEGVAADAVPPEGGPGDDALDIMKQVNVDSRKHDVTALWENLEQLNSQQHRSQQHQRYEQHHCDQPDGHLQHIGEQYE